MATKRSIVNYGGQQSEISNADVLFVETQNASTGLNVIVPFSGVIKLPIVTFTTDSLPTGNYKIDWYYEMQMTTGTTDPTITTEYTGASIIAQTMLRTSNVSNFFQQSGFAIVNLSGIHTLGLYFTGSNIATVNLRNARILLTRVI